MRHAPRRDANEASIIRALRQAGAFVWQLDQRNLPDLLVGFRRVWYVLEVKLPLGPKGGAKDKTLSEGQSAFFLDCAMRELPAHVVRSEEDALRAIGCLV